MERKTVRAIGYVRVSTEEQAASGLSLDSQRRKVEAMATLSDLDLADVLEDAGASASSLKRPGMNELMARVKGGQVDVIIIAKLDRLTRSIKDLSALLECLGKARRADGDKGVDLISTSESLDTSTATGRLVVNIMASVSQWEREVIAERTSAALQELLAQGRAPGNPAFGYQADDAGNLIEKPDEQRVLRRIESLRAEGQSWQAVANALTSDGLRTRKGGAFSRQGVHQIAKKAGLR